MKRFVVAAAGISLIAGGAALSPAAQAAPSVVSVKAKVASVVTPSSTSNALAAAVNYNPPAIKWGSCTFNVGGADIPGDCGYLVVPLDYAKPAGKKIKLYVTRIRHTSAPADYQGVMLTNPGGPGGSGAGLAVLGQFVPGNSASTYDWIGFDPRGVGKSVPSLTCDGSYFKYNRPNYLPTTQKIETTWLNRSKAYAKKCDKAGGALLDHVNTVDTVHDMESLRKALAATQINYYGFSYGTYLGQVYSTFYPTRVRRMILDSNVDPRGVWYKANLDQDIAFDKNIKIYFAWIAKYDSVYHLGTTEATVENLYYSTLKALGKKPAGGKIGPDELTDVLLGAGYYVYGWEDVADAFAKYVHTGAIKHLRSLYDDSNPQGAGQDNGFAMYLATQCTDASWSKSWFKWRVDNWTTYGKAPFETWDNAWFNAPCIYWGGKSRTPVTIDGSKAPSILLIDETNDAATPYEGSLYIRQLFPKSVLIEGVGGTTHAGSLSGVPCTDDKIAAYLTDGTLPPRVAGNTSDVQCDPVPQPDPTAAASASAFEKASSAGVTRADLSKLTGVR